MASIVSTPPRLQPPGEISREELFRRRHDDSLVIVDVLPKGACDGGHIPGAINLPLAELMARVPDGLPNRAAEIAVYCASFT